jgi:predicted nucleotide-binding protein (sugar kinase/HSP70/actin superfamily)
MSQLPTIGLPRALLYYKYSTLWKAFFKNLGFKTLVSPLSNRQILEAGVRAAIDENCLALKLYLGHVQALVGKVDYVFIPRLFCLYPQETLCTKFYALGDIVRNTFPELKLLEYNHDVEQREYEWKGYLDIGRELGINPFKTIHAYWQAKQEQLEAETKHTLSQAKQVRQVPQEATRILIAAHPYITYDAVLGKSICKILEEMDVEILYSDLAPHERARELSKQLSNDLYWTYNKEQIGAIEYYRHDIDGILFLVAFPCGPDALVVNLCQNQIKDIPICVLTLDELQGDAGLRTRIESFVDILRFKKGRTI